MSLNQLIDPQIAIGAKTAYSIAVSGISANEIKAESVQSSFLNMNSVVGTFRIQSQTPPATAVGAVGDTSGDVIFGQGDDYLYYCVGMYNGVTPIWRRVLLSVW